ncbi:hypothetical protein V5E97_02550 [Singulisphaera sp. Ch08]|uniref:PepSY domain-containing protein n=1 Tax=Singulisphaera sp. Ch08 TaxID=3120278 RepID=A0AAU7CIG5_9BACT
MDTLTETVIGPSAVIGRAARRLAARPLMYWTRRLHLYSGLFLFPWVMLYGVTALLFNHPEVFPDQFRRRLEAADVAGTGLDRLPAPAEAAAQLVAALNKPSHGGERSQRNYSLVDPETAAYTRDFIAARSRGDSEEHSIVLDLETGTGTVSTRALPQGGRPPFAPGDPKPERSLAERVKAGVPLALERKGLTSGTTRITFAPELTFLVAVDGTTWRASYNVQTGALTGRRPESGGNLSPREFLTRLHLTHGYHSHGWARIVWAVFVDVMFATMLFWGLSGLLMWWQMRSTRWLGGVVLCLGVTIAFLLTIGMYQVVSMSF